MADYPLLFGYRDLVAGNGFVAAVAVDGRACVVAEDGGAWVYGVNPGGVCAGGHDHGRAIAAFRAAYRSVLFDIAGDSATFTELEAGVEDFFHETNLPTEEAWERAVAAVRAGEVDLGWLDHRPADSARQVQVVEIETPKPDVNRLDNEAIAT